MSYKATIYNVMIASPSDVAKERDVARVVIHEWNAINAEDKKIVLLPIAWETHSSPTMGDRPQEIINKQVLNRADLLIAVFWTRVGSPTGKSPSGTIEEIEEHINAGKPAMIYFSSAPVHLESVDQQQYTALRQFHDQCKARGLIEEYDSISNFREKLSRQLAHTLIRNFAPSDSSEAEFQSADTSLADIAAARKALIPELSDFARQLLLEASQDQDGHILTTTTSSGFFVQTNGRNLAANPDARTEAKWKGALGQLYENGLIDTRGDKGEVSAVTDRGYEVADILREQD